MQSYIKPITDCFKITYRLDEKKLFPSKGEFKRNTETINCRSMNILSRPRLLKSLLTSNETKT